MNERTFVQTGLAIADPDSGSVTFKSYLNNELIFSGSAPTVSSYNSADPNETHLFSWQLPIRFAGVVDVRIELDKSSNGILYITGVLASHVIRRQMNNLGEYTYLPTTATDYCSYYNKLTEHGILTDPYLVTSINGTEVVRNRLVGKKFINGPWRYKLQPGDVFDGKLDITEGIRKKIAASAYFV